MELGIASQNETTTSEQFATEWIKMVPMLNGTLSIDGSICMSKLLNHLQLCLAKIRAVDITLHENTIRFRGGMWRFSGGKDFLVPFGTGRLVIDSERSLLKYQLSMMQLLVTSTCLFLVLAFVCFCFYREQTYWLALPLYWFFLTVPNVIIRYFRFRRFLQDSLKTSPRIADLDH